MRIVGEAMDSRLFPREHGAYAQLGFPLLSGLLLGAPGPASWLFACCAALLFAANEPLILLLGGRGKRLQEELAITARRRLFLLGAVAAAGGIAALWMAPPHARWLALIPAAFASCLLPLVFSGRLKSLRGEAVAAAAFSSMHLPVAAAGGVAGVMLWGPAVIWFATTMVASLCVHAIKSRVTGLTPWVVPLASWLAPAALLLAVAVWIQVPDWRALALAAAVPIASSVLVNFLSPSPKRLKRVGWTVAGANLLALLVLIVTGKGILTL
jgi:hypothetical protein